METVLLVILNLNIHIPFGLAIFLFCIYSTTTTKNVCIQMQQNVQSVDGCISLAEKPNVVSKCPSIIE